VIFSRDFIFERAGERREGEDSHAAAAAYDIPKFLARSVGWRHDARALRYSCQLREVLANATGTAPYLRPGLHWYRNPEYGRPIEDPDKRGRYGRPNAPGTHVRTHATTDSLVSPPPVTFTVAIFCQGFRWNDPSPYNYHGGRMGAPHADLSPQYRTAPSGATAATTSQKLPKQKASKQPKRPKPSLPDVANAAGAASAPAPATATADGATTATGDGKRGKRAKRAPAATLAARTGDIVTSMLQNIKAANAANHA